MPVGFDDDGSFEPRRTKSLPSKYMIPSAELGEYESANSRRRSAPAKPPSGGLFPLDEQGTYGALPQKKQGMPPTGIPFPRIRERKPKVYSSYSVDSNCQMHSKKLAKAERNAEQGIRKHSVSRAGSRAGSVSRASASPAPSRRYSSYGGSPSRASSSGRSSRSPEPMNGYRKHSGDKTYSS